MSRSDNTKARTWSGVAINNGNGDRDAARDLRPNVAHDDAVSLLSQHFSEPIAHLVAVEGGQVARTFSFTTGGEQYILRFNVQMSATFAKEAFIAGLVAPAGIPIPPLLHHGRYGELRYAISSRIPGVPLIQLDRAETVALMTALLDILDAIHAIDVGGTTGYAIAGDDGNGLYPSWRRWLESVNEEEPEWEYHGRWHTLFDTTFLERDAFDRLYGRMERLLPYCPEERHLIHGNFGFGNVLAHEGKITAVLDWLDAGYGDVLFDVAQLDFWDSGTRWVDRFLDRYRDRGVELSHVAERIQCYQCRTGLDAMRFFAKKRDEAAYRWICDRLSDLGLE